MRPTFLLILLPVFAVGCARTIPNTTVDDTPENRRVVEFMEDYRHAVEQRDVRTLLDMASPAYLDDNGTPIGDDDLDYDTLREKLSGWRERVTDVRYEIKYRRVSYDQSRIYVEFRYRASFQLAIPAQGEDDEEERWSRRLGDHRVVLTRDMDTDRFLILSGM